MSFNQMPGAREIFFKHASDEQLAYVSPVQRMTSEKFDAILNIGAFHNTRELSGVDPERQQLAGRAGAEIRKTFMKRMATRDSRWCYTVFPTYASAQEADMSLRDYENFVYGAGLLDEDDPVPKWQAESARQQKLIDWLAGKDKIIIKGSNVDLQMSIKERSFRQAAGKENFPDGEIYTSPVEESVNGWIRFGYPAIYRWPRGQRHRTVV